MTSQPIPFHKEANGMCYGELRFREPEPGKHGDRISFPGYKSNIFTLMGTAKEETMQTGQQGLGRNGKKPRTPQFY